MVVQLKTEKIDSGRHSPTEMKKISNNNKLGI